MLPTGTVTYLLTDVEGSTLQWAEEPVAMATAIARHYELLDSVVADHGGVRPVEQGEGDSIVAAFARGSDAVLAALDAQRRLAAESWPTSAPLKVRMAIHTGEARLRDEGNYAGNAIIRTARLRAIAHGGQVVLSSATRDLVVDELADGASLIGLGVHRLKDLSRPEHVWQLVHADLEADFPLLRSLDVVPNNLPVALSSFIGGFEAIDTVARLALDNRLVTLTGSGGAGKTRLAQQVAAEIAEAFPDGVWWVDLVGVDSADLIPSAISRAALLTEDRADRLGGVGRRLAPKRALLVLDNCEHVIEAIADAASSILTAAPDIVVLATSRAPLNVPGELTWRVPPLAAPAADRRRDAVEVMARYDAVRLFVDRATRVRQDFRLTEDNAAVVAEITSRLEGIPLALELAAGKSRVLTPGQILEGLTDAVGLLASTQRGVAPRHQTIDASIRWSHSLLTEAEQLLLRRLAGFAGPFSLEAAMAVTSDEQLPGREVLGVLEALVDQSLVQMDELGTTARFRVLETVKQFARRELESAGELDALSARHAAYFAGRARGLWPLFEPNMSDLLDQADAEFDDLREMLSHLERHASPEEHADVAMACLPAMSVRHMAEAAALGERAAARVDALSVLGGHLQLKLALVDPTMPQHVQLGLAAAEATGDPELQAHAAFWGAWEAASADPTPEAMAEFDAARQRLVDLGENHFSRSLWDITGIERATGHHAEAEGHWERSVSETICKRCNVMVWSEGALLALARGDLDEAERALARATELGVEVRDAMFQDHVRLTEAEVAVYAGKAWPAAEIEAGLGEGLATGHPLRIGFMSEARGLGRFVDGALEDAEEDLERAIVSVDEMWSKRTEARVRRAAIRHALRDPDGSAAIVAELRVGAARWDAGGWMLSQIDHRAAALALDRGEAGEADELAHRAHSDAWLGPWRPLVVNALELLASIAVARESYREAGRLFGAAASQRDAISFRLDTEPERSRLARDLATAREELGNDAFEAAADEGRRLSLDEAVAYARRARGERKRPSHGWDGLTPTERQVAELAVSGLTNAAIAERLFIGRETVKTHLSSVYAKVGVANRTQLVADAARRGLTP
jgi:predicted ATPase/class 3 adenylate cyclase/DNA-binding CsgD family transcriptional regulator